MLYGPRQVGKTTILQSYLQTTDWKYRLEIGEDVRIHEILGSSRLDWLLEYAQGYELIAIDEAQKIPNVGQGLKILIDNVAELRIIVTGSSSFELSGQIGEPLTGIKKTLTLYPVSQFELQESHNRFDLKQKLEDYLVFGSYPEVLTAQSRPEKIRIINKIAESYLLKDILELDRVRSSKLLYRPFKASGIPAWKRSITERTGSSYRDRL